MIDYLYNSPDKTEINQKPLRSLNRAIKLSQGEFSLILAKCDRHSRRGQIVKRLQQMSAFPIEQLTLHPSVKTLFTTIQTALKSQQPPALMVFGLESVIAIDELLIATNLMRNEFSKEFSFPLILWVNDEILQKMRQLAPDFRSWATSPICFLEEKKCFPITA
ncbi:MAG: hypothetical protein SAL07_12145 [Oscillatoria sp. PMC 1051.18]|uniref:hypothetical protein n=1 Tax=Oscillatoria salina TaxID=331517 RepID=UPI0013B9CCB0|nr:hypothetical protein [Oscillatoria salina]MBZ8182520.1 hypothetical protein [Oscillatoria salina IIICB1]MEC4892723.1 hypothetical protein [Oscillatoria sp. PMC 1050.18]MEC5030638.1 hypothetical protein [Oscillatoria sp. PMC 1051.18]NET90051.1 hypothetical protein [Kamptonema sp. SIO1D9]